MREGIYIPTILMPIQNAILLYIMYEYTGI